VIAPDAYDHGGTLEPGVIIARNDCEEPAPVLPREAP
jgi:hypothetical protein